MRDAQHLRVQSELCLELARQMSDHKTVENLQAEAARHRAEAAEIEDSRQPRSTSCSRSDLEQHQRDKSI